MKIERAILSVSDKSGISELARFLSSRGTEILSTGGTASHLEREGIPVTPVSRWSGAPEILGGRVKTLTPKVFGAILHDRSKEDHLRDCEVNSIPGIDLVVVNLYPFESTIAREGVTVAEAIEQIDIGGPSMLRAAAKNHRFVLPLCDPSLYEEFMREAAEGEVSEEFRRKCAVAVFRRTAEYDAGIASYLASADKGDAQQPVSTLKLSLREAQPLRYGENPQQKAEFYTTSGELPWKQVQGKELSFNNLLDLDAALRLATAFEDPACAIIKHTNPCGSAAGESIAEALRLALESDPVSAFGGIIGVNRPFDRAAATQIENLFLEVIVAPSFDEEALAILAKKKNLRLIEAAPLAAGREIRSAAGGYLVQDADVIGRAGWRVVTKREASPDEHAALDFAWTVCTHVKSNAIVLARHRQSVGVGAGQMSRVDAAKIAIMKSVLPTHGTVAASDAFFPFRDGVDVLADSGVTAIIQPGGSVRDEEVIAAADERGVTMIFTGERHFRH